MTLPEDTSTPPATRYEAPRAPTPAERSHPLAESGWQAVAHTTLDGEVDTLMLEKAGRHRLVELYDDYAWCRDKRRLAWEEFIRLQTETGDRRGWTDSIAEKMAAYGQARPSPAVWVARNDDFGADWLLGLEF